MKTSVLFVVLLCCSGFSATAQSSANTAPTTTATLQPNSKPEKVFDEIVVVDERDLLTSGRDVTQSLNTTEDALSLIGGVTMMQRGNIAWEPSIRGMSAGQISLTIDGMKMVGACVDRMDPITAYIDIDNLQRIELSKGASDISTAQSIGGTLTMHTARPAFGAPLSLRFKSGIESISSQTKLYTSITDSWGDNLTAHAAVSLKRSGDYSAGNTTPIANSGFARENYKLDVGWRPSAEHTVFASAIVDRARDMGYPALIMDTRNAESYIASVEHTWRGLSPRISALTTRIYANGVHHLMDDYDRSREEIRTRIIMPNMYMPMEGTSRTIGVMSNALCVGTSEWLKLTAEVYRLDAFADMTMHSLTPNVPSMYVINIGDARLYNAALAAEYFSILSPSLQWRNAARVEYSNRTLTNAVAQRVLQSYTTNSELTRQYVAFGATSTLDVTVATGATLSGMLARVQRMPTHIENYGFYLYSPMDNAIYIGNPQLEPETSWQSEVSFGYTGNRALWKITAFGTWITNYIAGTTFVDGDTANVQFSQAFRRYEHRGNALIAGLEANALFRLSQALDARLALTWQRGRAFDIDDDLPFMPPLQGSARLAWNHDIGRLEVWARAAAAQHTYSTAILPEDATPGYAVLDLRYLFRFTSWGELNFGVENVFDTYYHEHASISNLPARGRNFYATVELRY